MTRYANPELRPNGDSVEELIGDLLSSEDDEPFVRFDSAWVDWLYWAGNIAGKAPLQTAIMLADAAVACGRLSPILVTPTWIEEHGLVRETVSRALTSLEGNELITVQRRKGTSPIVSILLPES